MLKLLTLVGLGAGAAYLLDPEKGAQRREQLKHQAVDFLDKLDKQAAVDAEDPGNPMSGVIRWARPLIHNVTNNSEGGIPARNY
jgi:hypothetical protein